MQMIIWLTVKNVLCYTVDCCSKYIAIMFAVKNWRMMRQNNQNRAVCWLLEHQLKQSHVSVKTKTQNTYVQV